MSLLRSGVEIFTVGRALYADHPQGLTETSAKIWITFRTSLVTADFTALLDTGAAYSMLNNEVSERLGLFSASALGEISISTRLGPVRGQLVRTPITLVAVEGDSLEIDATVFVSREWAAPNFIGYGGFLERVRFAIDPGQGRNDFHFGPAE